MIADSIFPDVSLPLAEKAYKGTDAKCFYDFYRPMVYRINFFLFIKGKQNGMQWGKFNFAIFFLFGGKEQDLIVSNRLFLPSYFIFVPFQFVLKYL